MFSTGSPGVRWISRKTPSVTRKSTGIVASRRRATSRPIGAGGLLQPDVFEAHHAVRHRVVALDLRTESFGLDGMNDEDARHFLAQQQNQLAVQLFALGVVGDLVGLLE